MMLRKILERISRNVILRRKMPAEFGRRRIYVSPEGGLRYWRLSLESVDSSILNVVQKFVSKNDTIWDIGANVGYFSLAASHVAGHKGYCLSVEPDIWLCRLLRKTASVNPDLNIEVLPIAISNSVGIERFNITNRSRSTNYLDIAIGTSQTGGVRQKVIVPTMSLDDLLRVNGHPPNFVKIDVETAEHYVFEGAENLLSNVKPIIYCEVAKENQEFIREKLLKNDYDILDGDALDAGAVNYMPYNVLAIPRKTEYVRNSRL